jgi:uncharacterized membrane protein YbhN (UPF0104 family)
LSSTLQQIRSRVGNRGIAAAAAALLLLIVAVATPQLLGTRVAAALGALHGADPKWLWIAGLGFVLSVVGAAGAWRSAIGLCGGHTTVIDACARHGAGSLVNTFVPARAGDAVRIALFSRVLSNPERIWTAGSALAVQSAAGAVVLAALIVAGAAAGVVPLWPLAVALALVAAAVAVSLKARGRQANGRLAHLLDAFRALGHDPVAGLRIVGWLTLSTLGRMVAATAVAASLGIAHPLIAALVIIPALEVAGLIPITPGNVGVTSAAIAIAFQAQGVSFTSGLAAGIAFHAVETAVGIMYGLASVLWLAPFPSPGIRRVALIGTGASWVLGIAGAFSATVLVPLV